MIFHSRKILQYSQGDPQTIRPKGEFISLRSMNLLLLKKTQGRQEIVRILKGNCCEGSIIDSQVRHLLKVYISYVIMLT